MESDTKLARSLADARKHAVEAVAHVKELGVERSRELALGVDRKVRRDPWPFIGAAAAVGLLLGFILGRRRE